MHSPCKRDYWGSNPLSDFMIFSRIKSVARTPENGDHRVRKCFAWFPVRIENESECVRVWLKSYWVLEKFLHIHTKRWFTKEVSSNQEFLVSLLIRESINDSLRRKKEPS